MLPSDSDVMFCSQIYQGLRKADLESIYHLCITFVILSTGLNQCLVLTVKYLCYRFLLFMGPANKTDILVFVIKHTVLYISQSVVYHKKKQF